MELEWSELLPDTPTADDLQDYYGHYDDDFRTSVIPRLPQRAKPALFWYARVQGWSSPIFHVDLNPNGTFTCSVILNGEELVEDGATESEAREMATKICLESVQEPEPQPSKKSMSNPARVKLEKTTCT